MARRRSNTLHVMGTIEGVIASRIHEAHERKQTETMERQRGPIGGSETRKSKPKPADINSNVTKSMFLCGLFGVMLRRFDRKAQGDSRLVSRRSPMKRILQLIVGTLVVVTSNLHAVEPEKPSKTSIWVLAARAVGAHDPDPTVRNPDWLAERFLGPDERAQIPENYAVRALDQDYRTVMKDPTMGALVRAMTVRTRFMDDHLLRAVAAGAVQVVNLGAGFDSRAWRFRSELRNTRIFEVDYGPTQEYKRRRVAAVIGPAPQNLVYVLHA
jgi:hypothetical protein